ncbi:TonB-dependent receptor plug domain-containing protein [Daejeonella lutea]|uniref:TonB-dependent receptor plug domain-containing protein n=1 Tax=Daejeonella lutea TaxID=572036 RepID=UPI0009A79043|nr:Plug domain-containing protein [Daejeonella lutea]
MPDTTSHQRVFAPQVQKEYALQQIPDSAILALTDEAEVNRLLRVAQIEKMQLLDEVKVSAQRVNEINDSKNINTTPAIYTLPEKHFEQYSNMRDALESKIPSLVFNGNLMKFRNDSISIFVDGVPMDADFRVRDINTADVAGLEVLTGAQSALYGRKAILFVTLKTGMTKSSSSMGQASIMVNGYSFNREFYSPRFDKPVQIEAIDYRKTIYWNPNLLTREGLSQEFSFYTGNKPGRYRFVIEGIDEFGNVFRKVFSREIR